MSEQHVLRLGGHGPVRRGPTLATTRPDMQLLQNLADMGFPVAKASKALEETQNNLAAALDWLDSHQDWEIPVEVLNQSLMDAQPGLSPTDVLGPDLVPTAQPRTMQGIQRAEQEHAVPPTHAPSAVEVATLSSAPETAGPIASRYDLNSKDAYRERKRQKEIEQARLDKIKQQEEAARIKAEVARQREERAAASGKPLAESSAHTSFEERQRQKEAEERDKKRAQEAAERDRVLKQIEEERKAKFGDTTDDGKPKLTPAESKAAFVDKQKEKQKEAWRVEQEENAKRLAELRRQLQEDKERKAALRADASSSNTSTTPTAATTSSSTHTPETRPTPVSRPPVSAPPVSTTSPTNSSAMDISEPTNEEEAGTGPLKSVAEQMAEARRARLGITKVTGVQAHATGGFGRRHGPQTDDDDDDTTDIDEIKRRNKARAAAASSTSPAPEPVESPPTPTNPTGPEALREIHQRRFEEQRRREQEEAERKARAERAQRMLANTTSLKHAAPSAPPVVAPTFPDDDIPLETSNPEIPEERTIISLRLPDGRIKKSGFKSRDPLSEIKKYAASWLPLDTIFSLLIPVPRQEFTDEMLHMTLAETGLCPRGILTVLPLQSRGTVRQAPPRPQNLQFMMRAMNYEGTEMEAAEELANMPYEELLALQERIGYVPTGLTDREIADLPKSKFEPTESDEAFCVICQVDIEKGETIIKLPKCSHIFHKDHLEQWLKDNRTCPACRARVYIGKKQETEGAEDGEDDMDVSSHDSSDHDEHEGHSHALENRMEED